MELLLYLSGACLLFELAFCMPMIHHYSNEDFEETEGVLIDYEVSYSRRHYMYAMMIEYKVDGKKYLNIERISRNIKKKKVGSKVVVMYNKKNPIDSSVKYDLKNEVIIFFSILILNILVKMLR